jgi:hypothetical protein
VGIASVAVAIGAIVGVAVGTRTVAVAVGSGGVTDDAQLVSTVVTPAKARRPKRRRRDTRIGLHLGER